MHEIDKKRDIVIVIVIVLLVLTFIFYYVINKNNDNLNKKTISNDNPVELSPQNNSFIRGIYNHKGVLLKQLDCVTNVLFVGVDNHIENGIEKKNADFILLVVINKKDKTIKPIFIRKSITCNIGELDEKGQLIGSKQAEIGNAFSYGTGQLDSLANVKEAVSDLMCNIKIDHYISANFDLSEDITDKYGGIEISSQKDLSFIDESFVCNEDNEILLNKNNVHPYLTGDIDNESLKDIEDRQTTFVSTVYKLFKEDYKKDITSIIDVINTFSNQLCINSNDIVTIANFCMEYELLDLESIEGYIEDGELVVNKDDLSKICIEYIYQ